MVRIIVANGVAGIIVAAGAGWIALTATLYTAECGRILYLGWISSRKQL